MSLPQDNISGAPDDTHFVSVQDWTRQLPLLLDGRGRARHTLRRFVVYLAGYADADGTSIFPSVDRVAADMHASRRTVFRLYREAEDAKQIIRDGHSSRGTIRVRLNMELDREAGWLPYDAAAEHRRERSRERVQRWRERQAGGDMNPVTETLGGDKYPVTEPACNGVAVTQPSLSDHHEEHLQRTTAVAAAPAVQEILEAELVEETTNLPAVRADVVPAVPDVSSSWLLPEELPKGRKPPADASRFDATQWPQPQEARTPSAWTQTLIGYWVERCRERGFEPGGRHKGQAAREIKALVWAGNNPNHIARAAERAAERDGAWITRAMSEVRPGGWAAHRPGRQVVLEDRIIQLPAGATAGQARSVSIAALFPDV